MTNSIPTATKHDSGKPMLGLISSKFLIGLANVLTFGAKKYAAHNWRSGFFWSRPYDALMRHLVAWNDGEDLDHESGMPHLDHAACELMFLRELTETHKGLDDRYRSPVEPDRPVMVFNCFRCEYFFKAPQEAMPDCPVCKKSDRVNNQSAFPKEEK